ncbi:DUF3376 domain-containing protein [Blastococcus saxobsidens]|uniref:Patatin-related protein n=1 Tax=Blastococcus saxobsidens TaxID=138336 RepID=A0A4Q7Y303_9ACTN|nr:DUF3376 domain-containing protein [Blastococcus saxobsidens]RZU30451.1 patatin-related protein [Blastococcus saxobsidens]
MAEATQGRRRRELRVALVLNGGVSLAVWMGGVTHEIDLLRRASRVACGMEEYDPETVAVYDRPVFEKWVELCRRSDVGAVVVDVIAGTSAGGLNGTLLATAVARGVPLDPPGQGVRPALRTVWSDSASLEDGSLLRLTQAPALSSVLDGDFFRREIDRVVGRIGAAPGRPAPEPVTLFVTATALGESSQKYVDSFGQPFDVADHRHLYRFRRTDEDAVVFRPGAGDPDGWWPTGAVDGDAAFVDDFDRDDADCHEALVTAARASASFPVAFAPVQEGEALARRRVLPATSVDCHGRRWLVDGGILDNAPFEPVLDAISRRPATEPVRRLLVYVVPSRGAGNEGLDAPPPETAGGAAAAHPAWKHILGGAVGFPREGDVRADMESAANLLRQGEATEGSPEVGPEALFGIEVDAASGAADGLLEQYRRARAIGGLQDVRRALSRARQGRGLVLAPVSGPALAELLGEEVPWVPPAEPDWTGEGDQWRWGLGAAERVCRLFVRDLWDRGLGGAAAAPVTAALARVEAVRDAVTVSIVQNADKAPLDDLGLVAWASDRFAALQVQEALAHCVGSAARGYAAARSGVVEPAAVVRAGLTVEVATNAFSAYQPFRRTSPFEFLRLGPDVEAPFVDCVDAAPDVVRTRARDARRTGDKKLYGTRMGHFAAFGLDTWRAWDWTAGRLDAQTHLARALLDSPDGPAATVDWTASVQEVTVRAELGRSPAEWAQQRGELLGKDDGSLLRDLRREPYGETLAVAVVDAVMRALPHDLALGRSGQLLNSLVARSPVTRTARWWAPVARPVVRWKWLRWTSRLGR